MLQKLKAFWNFDFGSATYRQIQPWVFIGTLFLFIFGWFDITMDTGSGLHHWINKQIEQGHNPLEAYLTNTEFVFLVQGLLFLLGIYITVFALWSYFGSIRRYGKEKFAPIFIAHLLSNAIAMLLMALILVAIGLVAWAMGFTFFDGQNFISHAYGSLSRLVKDYVPTLIELPYPLALLLGIIMGALPGYFSHWLAHQSRFIWLLNHRCHHTAELMHPAGIGPFFFFPEFFSNVPTAILSAAVSKLFYYEPLVWENLVLAALYVFTEKFNHSTYFYDFAYHFKPIWWLSSYFGNGTFHYLHHSAIPGEETINLGGAPFLVWDRLFGTYRLPTAQKPPVGLTNQPPIKLSPFALILSGWQQMAYELKNNKDWVVRFKIIFGDIYFMPPVTKDFLKREKAIDLPNETSN
jgi:sterol desaturase/sphingolipid hydroxylase (fatty acid hydroxylase superfamily)